MDNIVLTAIMTKKNGAFLMNVDTWYIVIPCYNEEAVLLIMASLQHKRKDLL